MESSNLPVPSGGLYPVPGTGSLEVARKLKVSTDIEYETAAEMLKSVKHELKKVDELEEEEKRPLLDKLQEIRDRYKPSKTEYSLAEAHLKKLLDKYRADKERLRLEAQRKADEEAARERAKLQKRAEKAAASGKHEKAAALAEQAEGVVAVVIHNEAPKVDGVHGVPRWDFEIIDEALIPSVYKIVDIKKLAKIVSVMKEAAQAAIGPGIRVFKTTTTSSTSKQSE